MRLKSLEEFYRTFAVECLDDEPAPEPNKKGKMKLMQVIIIILSVKLSFAKRNNFEGVAKYACS